MQANCPSKTNPHETSDTAYTQSMTTIPAYRPVCSLLPAPSPSHYTDTLGGSGIHKPM